MGKIELHKIKGAGNIQSTFWFLNLRLSRPINRKKKWTLMEIFPRKILFIKVMQLLVTFTTLHFILQAETDD
ncbi:hypothetical protein R3W88_032744 [Solanum pinnatisectum]|uniref:Uncharacterized protein n=1 Tax=Solanum pinnatisectum TaxID=50273 RepID=A0AAV9LTY7_9SOLN|nr:hypothetical protein R3W88_032744 [Solanum pinnatisectum]